MLRLFGSIFAGALLIMALPADAKMKLEIGKDDPNAVLNAFRAVCMENFPDPKLQESEAISENWKFALLSRNGEQGDIFVTPPFRMLMIGDVPKHGCRMSGSLPPNLAKDDVLDGLIANLGLDREQSIESETGSLGWLVNANGQEAILTLTYKPGADASNIYFYINKGR